MTYNAFITRIKDVRKHPNADKLLIGNCFGQQVVVGLDTKDNELIIYFPTDGRLSMEFMEANNLIAKKDPVTGERTGGYFDERGKVRTQKFRGEPSDGYVCVLSYLLYTGIDILTLQEGTPFTELNGHKICEKYITQETKEARTKVAKPREKTEYPCFHEHPDTEQLAYNIGELKSGSVLVLTEKVHGTSQRSGHTIELKQTKFGHFINGIFKREIIHPVKDYGYICGTRRVVLRDLDNPSGYYGVNEMFRKTTHEMFAGKLHKGESVYYEIVGWANKDVLIMPECNNKKLNDKEFVKKYGERTIFHYGCNQDTFGVIVYRMSMTNEDGHEVDYDWNMVKYRCNQMAVKHVPEMTKFVYDGNKDNLFALCEQMAIGNSLLTPAHLREGVVVRVDGSQWYALKHKSFAFKVLEGIIKESAVVDMEEAQDV
jgi:tRNA-binding EMAP/Myf-like protein